MLISYIINSLYFFENSERFSMLKCIRLTTVYIMHCIIVFKKMQYFFDIFLLKFKVVQFDSFSKLYKQFTKKDIFDFCSARLGFQCTTWLSLRMHDTPRPHFTLLW